MESSVLERHRAVGEHPEEGHKNGPRDGTPPYEYRLRAGMCSLEKGRLWGDLRVAFSIERGCKNEGDRLFSRVCCDRTRGNGFKLKERRFRLNIRKKFFYNKCGKALEQVAQRGGGCPILGDTQGQAGWGSEQPDVAVVSLFIAGELDQMVFTGSLELRQFSDCII